MPVQSIPYPKSGSDFSKIVKAVIEDGVVIVTNVLSPEEVLECRQGLHQDLKENFGVEVGEGTGLNNNSLENTAHLMEKIQTHPSGGLPFHYSKWRMKHCCLNKKALKVTRELWEATYAQGDIYICKEKAKDGSLELTSKCENNTNLPTNRLDNGGRPLWGTPYGKFLRDEESSELIAFPYIDSLNFRLPTSLASYEKKNGRKVQFQRHIAAHADVNFWDMFGGRKGRTRWRPFQAFLALTDNTKKDNKDYMAGGLEVVTSFHKEASTFFASITEGYGQSNAQFEYNREFCGSVRMAEKNDPNEKKRFKSIRARFESLHYPAGSFVFWDWRIPHRQQERNDGTEAREVVYTSFLPSINVPAKFLKEPNKTQNYENLDIRINDIYAEKQLSDLIEGRFPPDFTSDSLNKKWNGKVPGWRMNDIEELFGTVWNDNGRLAATVEDTTIKDINFNRILLGMK